MVNLIWHWLLIHPLMIWNIETCHCCHELVWQNCPRKLYTLLGQQWQLLKSWIVHWLQSVTLYLLAICVVLNRLSVQFAMLSWVLTAAALGLRYIANWFLHGSMKVTLFEDFLFNGVSIQELSYLVIHKLQVLLLFLKGYLLWLKFWVTVIWSFFQLIMYNVPNLHKCSVTILCLKFLL